VILELVQKCSVHNNETSSFVNRGALQVVLTLIKKTVLHGVFDKLHHLA